MTSHTPDDGFHEIQLNGKQLVFLFMAATVVSVVIFLLGVLVGRDVRADTSASVEPAILDVPIAEGTAAGDTAAAAADPRTAVPPPPAREEPSFFDRLESPKPVAEELKPVAAVERRPPSPPSAEPAPITSAPAAAAPVPQPQAAAVSAKPAPVAKGGYVVQLAALNSESEADAMAKRLSAKGYDAYVQPPAAGAPAIFRVRVGNYPTRRDAETAAAQLEKEGQFKPWVAPR